MSKKNIKKLFIKWNKHASITESNQNGTTWETYIYIIYDVIQAWHTQKWFNILCVQNKSLWN